VEERWGACLDRAQNHGRTDNPGDDQHGDGGGHPR
jgi:hypothetical protein